MSPKYRELAMPKNPPPPPPPMPRIADTPDPRPVSQPAELTAIRARIAAMRPWPEGEDVLAALERYADTLDAARAASQPSEDSAE